MAVNFSAIVDGIQTRKDGTLSLKLGTQDMETIHNVSDILSMANKYVYVAIAETPVKADSLDIPEHTLEPNDKSPSQRLRSVLYVYWEQQGKKEDFELFYRKTMEKFIDNIKDKLT